MTVIAIGRPAEQAEILLSIRNEELRRQLCEFLADAGYACIPADNVSEPPCEVSLVVAEVEVQEAPVLARTAAAARPDLRMLFVCGEPAYIGRALLPDPRVAFIEKPFAWCDLRRALLDLLRPCAHGHTATPAAVA